MSCEIVGHCVYALQHLRAQKEFKKGCTFTLQLTGDESIYHTLAFVNGQQHLIKPGGDKEYLEDLLRKNAKSTCLQKEKV
jgi:hypothetical protein